MATSIASSKFSFVRFEPVDYSLPAYRQFDVAFQFVVNGFYSIENDLKLGVADLSGIPADAFASEIKAEILGYKMKIPAQVSALSVLFLLTIVAGNKMINYNKVVTYAEFKQILADDFGYQVTFENSFITKSLTEIIFTYSETSTSQQIQNTLQSFWGIGYLRANYDLISPFFKTGQCFRYIILDDSANPVGYSNSFVVLNEREYRFSSLVSYQNNEDAFEFIYNGYEENIVRLPMYLSRPQWPEKKTVYIKSNGEHKLTAAFIEEEYQLKTDHLSAQLHRLMKIALAHDQVIIDCPNLVETPVKIINQDSYNPEWDEEIEIDRAQATSRVTVATFGYRNDNCETREFDCPMPILTVDGTTETTADLKIQVGRGVNFVLLNYKKLGAAIWKTLDIGSDSSYTLTDLDEATDYEIRAAGKCGTVFGQFGITKSFRTIGVQACSPPSNLVFISRTGNILNFQVDLPDPEAALMELLVTRPDNSITKPLYGTSGFTGNPFSFVYDMGPTQQYGNYKFNMRSKCGDGDYSSYANEVTFSYQSIPQTIKIQYDFAVMFDQDGTLNIYVNDVLRINSLNSSSNFVTANAGEQVRVFLRSRTGTANLKIYETASQIQIYDSTGNNNYVEDYSFIVAAGESYYIDASIG